MFILHSNICENDLIWTHPLCSSICKQQSVDKSNVSNDFRHDWLRPSSVVPSCSLRNRDRVARLATNSKNFYAKFNHNLSKRHSHIHARNLISPAAGNRRSHNALFGTRLRILHLKWINEWKDSYSKRWASSELLASRKLHSPQKDDYHVLKISGSILYSWLKQANMNLSSGNP